MARTQSDNYREKVSSTSGEEPVYLLEISHPQLSVPVRLVRDTVELTSNGNLYQPMAFEVTPPDDVSQQLPQATLSMDNIGRELMQWIEASDGGRGAMARMMQVMRNAPDVIEFDITIALSNVKANISTVSGTLSYEDVLNVPALCVSYTPATAPGLF